jgi:hypothetical protein
MSIVRRTLIFSAMTMTFAQPVMAQRGGQARPPASRPDTTRKGVSLDFQDQDLKVVLDALAAAGDLNVSMTNIPQQRITVHMGRPVSREGMIELVKSIAESNGLKVTETPTLLQISGPTPEPPGRQQQSLAQQMLQQQQQQQQQQQMRLFTYRLKHASAIQLAPCADKSVLRLRRRSHGRRNDDHPERERRIHDHQHGSADAAGQHPVRCAKQRQHSGSVHSECKSGARWQCWPRRDGAGCCGESGCAERAREPLGASHADGNWRVVEPSR